MKPIHALISFLLMVAMVVATASPAAAETTSTDVAWGWAADDPTPAPGAVVFDDRAKDTHCVYVETWGPTTGTRTSHWSCGPTEEFSLRPSDTHYRLCRTGLDGICTGWIRTLRAQGKA